MIEFKRGDPPPQDGWTCYRKKTVVSMLRMAEPFRCETWEGWLEGKPGDFLVHDGYGGYYLCGAEFHATNYEPA